jgi:hypothetical protein
MPVVQTGTAVQTTVSAIITAAVTAGETLNAATAAFTTRSPVLATDLVALTDSLGAAQYSAPATAFGGGSIHLFTTGAAGTMSSGQKYANLNGVGATFALTLPAPQKDGDKIYIGAVTAVGTAFSVVPTSPATTSSGVPTTLSAGQYIALFYSAANTTWYRVQ